MRIAEREAKPRGEGWRDMRLSRNRGNARGPTRLTNPLHRATSCRTRAFARSIARSLARPSCHQTLPCHILPLPLPSSERNALLLSSTFRHSTHILLLPAIFLPPSCLSLLFPSPPPRLPSFPSSSIHPVLPPCTMHSFHLSLFYNPPTTRIHLPLLLLPRPFFLVCYFAYVHLSMFLDLLLLLPSNTIPPSARGPSSRILRLFLRLRIL